MKKLLLLALFSTNLLAAERVLLSDSLVTDVVLNTSSVRCTVVGYSMPELKINIKGLDGWTIFDHTNIKAGDFSGSPCMTAGYCPLFGGNDGFKVEDIISTGERTERIKINREIVEVKLIQDKPSSDEKVCSRHIEERLKTAVTRADGTSDIQFKHTRTGVYEIFPLSVCEKSEGK